MRYRLSVRTEDGASDASTTAAKLNTLYGETKVRSYTDIMTALRLGVRPGRAGPLWSVRMHSTLCLLARALARYTPPCLASYHPRS